MDNIRIGREGEPLCGQIENCPVMSCAQHGIAEGGEKDFFQELLRQPSPSAVRKQHMIHNSYLPTMEIDAQTHTVRADGQLLSCEPALKLPMAQRYFLF